MNNILNHNNKLTGNDYPAEDLEEIESVVGSTKSELSRKKDYNSELISNIKALSRYFTDNNVKWYRKSVVLATIAYFAKPKGALRNWEDFFYLLENVNAVEWAVKFLGNELKEYY